MEFNDYQEEALKTMFYSDMEEEFWRCHREGITDSKLEHDIEHIFKAVRLLYMSTAISGETGELSEKIKKIVRDDKGHVSVDKLELIKKEMGDILWYLAALSYELGFPLDEVASGNISKIADRFERGVLAGSGDKR